MKILCVSSSYPRFESDIAGHFVEELNGLLRSNGHEIKTLAWRGEGTSDRKDLRFVPYAPPRFETLFFRFGAPENLTSIVNQLLTVPAMAAMWRAIAKEKKPDLIIGHWALPGGILARLASHYFGVPSVVVGHSGGLHRLGKMSSHSILKSIVLDGPTTIPSSAFRSVAPNATFLPIGFHPIESSLPRRESEDALIMSRLEPIKNIERSIRGWSSRSAVLHIAGEGSCREELEQLAKELGKNVVFHGLVTGKEKAELMSSVKYFFLPSKVLGGRHEGFPIGLLQAIDFGLIPLVANFPGARDILSSTFLVREDEDWKGRFEALAFSKEEYIALQARVYERLWSQIGEVWLELVATTGGTVR